MTMVSALLILGSGGVLPRSLPISFIEGKRGGSHGLCPSDLEKSRSVARGIPISPLEGKRGGRHSLCLSDLEKWWSVAKVTVNPFSGRKEGNKPWSLPF